VLAAYVPPSERKARKSEKAHAFVKMWTIADLDPLLPQVAKGRNFANGRDAFAAAQCILCHRFGDEGGAVGPDLTSIASRFSLHDIAESIVDPSKVISEQYANEEFTLKNGDIALGRVVGETPDSITVRPSLLAPQLQDVKKAEIKTQAVSKVSPMPPALISILSEKDVLDLLAYLASQGKEDAPAFAK
jgi:putative heme-binding domain-containing protein